MFSTLSLALLAIVGAYLVKLCLQFRRNLKAAQDSGITYIIVPFMLTNRFYQIICIFLVPLMRKLPESWTYPWFDLTLEPWVWDRRHEPFKRLGTDTFLAVSPERNVMYTADADVISQITTRRSDFPKALEVYGSIKIFGNNVVTSEGQLWKHHRKITSPPFSEKNNHLVWTETLGLCQTMVSSWLEGGPEATKSIYTIADDAMRLSLYVISRAGFGVRLQWPGSNTNQAPHTLNKGESEGSEIPEGHTMSYTDALGILLHNILFVLVLPRFLLKYLPFQRTKDAYESFIEWGKYQNEIFQSKKAAVLNGTEGDDLDLMIALVKGAGITQENAAEGDKAAPQSLTNEEILGNAFIFILAGHETTANSIHFCLVLLAAHIQSQRHLQADLDEIIQGRPVSQWDYDEIVPKLFGSMAGAVLNEELRLLAPVTGLPKCTPKGIPHPLNVAGKKCTVPENVYTVLVTPAVHRNPNFWPSGPPTDPQNPVHPLSNLDNDLEEFKPERWLLGSEEDKSASMPGQERDTEASNLGVNTAADTSAALYRPVKGAYIPFSEGYRSCIGRRFAQVELLAVIALIFSQYSVELAVDAYATDDEINKMNGEERRDVWQKAKNEVNRQMREDMGSIITLQLRKGAVGLRFVKRGKERFDWK